MTGPSRMTTGAAAELIAEFVSRSWPSDKADLFKILGLVQNHIWKTGLFANSTAWMKVNTYSDGTIITPPGYDTLLGLNINEKPQVIRDKYFLFHANGPGSMGAGFNECCADKNFTRDVYDLGESATLMKDEDCCKDRGCFNIGVESSVCEEGKTTLVTGLNCCGKPLITYKKTEGTKEVLCVCESEEQAQEIEVVSGVEYKISNKLQIFQNISFSAITDITKPNTRGTVSYYLVDEFGNKEALLAEIGPNDTHSSYRSYRLPFSCEKRKCILGLFKVSKPRGIFSPTQRMLIDDEPTLISLAKGVEQEYFKDNPAAAAPHYAAAISHMNADVRSSRSNAERPIQVRNHMTGVRGLRRM